MLSDYDGFTVTLPYVGNPFGRPREPTPGSTFKLPKRPFGNPVGSDGGEINYHGEMVAGNINSRITGVNDAQMTSIPRRHAEKGSKAKGKSIISGLVTGVSDNNNGIFSSIVGSNGSSLITPSQLSSLTQKNPNLTPGNGFSSMREWGFDVDNMEDEDEMNTVKGHVRNGQVQGPEYIIMTPVNVPCPGQGDVLIMEIKPYQAFSEMRTFFQSYSADLQGHGKNFDGHQGFSLAGFNYYIASLQHYSSQLTPDGALQTFREHRDLIHSFNILGVINSEIFVGGGASYQAKSEFTDLAGRIGNTNQKSVNVVHQGSVITNNLYGPVSAGCCLYFIWKKIPIPTSYYLDSTRQMATIPKPSSGHLQSQFPFQLVPFAHPCKAAPSMSDLEYISDHESWVVNPTTTKSTRKPMPYIGEGFRIGQVNKPMETTSYSTTVQTKLIEIACKRAVYDQRMGQDNHLQIFVKPSFLSPFKRLEGTTSEQRHTVELVRTPGTTVVQRVKKPWVKNDQDAVIQANQAYITHNFGM